MRQHRTAREPPRAWLVRPDEGVQAYVSEHPRPPLSELDRGDPSKPMQAIKQGVRAQGAA